MTARTSHHDRQIRRTRSILVSCILGAAIGGAAIAAESGGGFSINWRSIDAGGGTSAMNDWSLVGAVGQPEEVGPSQGGGFSITGGFLQGPPPPPPCPGDSNGDLVVNVADLLDVINNWGGDGATGGDVTGDNLVNVADLLEVINNWGAAC